MRIDCGIVLHVGSRARDKIYGSPRSRLRCGTIKVCSISSSGARSPKHLRTSQYSQQRRMSQGRRWECTQGWFQCHRRCRHSRHRSRHSTRGQQRPLRECKQLHRETRASVEDRRSRQERHGATTRRPWRLPQCLPISSSSSSNKLELNTHLRHPPVQATARTSGELRSIQREPQEYHGSHQE